MTKLFDRRRPAKIIQHPQYGQKLLQDGRMFFMDGTPFDPPKKVEETPPTPQHTDARPTAQAEAPRPVSTEATTQSDPNGYLKMQWFKLKGHIITKLNGPAFQRRDEALTWLREKGHLPAG
jgi:hypothetical protein